MRFAPAARMVQKVAVDKREIDLSFDVATSELPCELVGHPLLCGVGQKTLQVLSTSLEHLHLARGARLYRAEQTARCVYLLVSGKVRTVHQNALGETFETSWLQGPAALGVGELLAGLGTMQETAEVVEDAVLIALPMSVLRELLASDGKLPLNLATALAGRHMEGLKNERQILESAFYRVADYLATLSARSGQQMAPDLVQVKVTQDDIAAAKGINPRTVARALKVLQQKGRLSVRRGEYLLREPATLASAFTSELS